MKRLIIDLDGTLTHDDPALSYVEKRPDLELIQRLAEYRDRGFSIVIQTARGMRTYDGQIGFINIHTLPTILEWLKKHKVPFDEVQVGKPWCGTEGFYVDDRAIRPNEFLRLSFDEITTLLQNVPAFK